MQNELYYENNYIDPEILLDKIYHYSECDKISILLKILDIKDKYDFEFKESNKVISLKMDGDITQKGLSLYKELSHYVLHE